MLKAKPALMTLTSVLAIATVGLLIALFVVLGGIDLIQQGLYDSEYSETFVGSDACAEEALLELNNDSGYSGGSFTIGSISCTATVSGSGSTRTLSVTASQGDLYVSDLELSIDLSTSPISITNWEQVN